MNKYFLFFLLICGFSCAGPQKSLDKKNYDKAFKLALKELKKGKSVSANKKVLSQALTFIIDERYGQIASLVASNDIEDWEKAIGINRSTQDQILKASTYLGDQNERTAVDLEEREVTMMQSIYEVYFQDGKELLANALSQNDKLLAQKAYFDLTKAKDYALETSPELDAMIQESLEKGVINYTFEIDALSSISHKWEINRKFDDIEDLSHRFGKISFESNQNIADCIIEIDFDRLDFIFNESSDRQSFQQRVITGYNTVVDTSGTSSEEPIYENVEGTVYTIARAKVARWDIQIDVNSKSPNCNVSSSYFDVALESVIEVYRLEGDQRAIPDEYKNPPRQDFLSDDDMAEELIEIIYEEVVNRCFG